MYKEVRKEESLLRDKLEIKIIFDESAVDELIRESIKTGRDSGPLTFYIAKRLEYGLKLIRDRSGIEKFTIGSEAITDMEDYINRLLKKYYRQNLDSGMKDIYQDKKAFKE
jgi:hypothetical protein